MASHVVVIDSSFRRTVVKVTPGTFMTDVLEEACGKFKMNASNYGLKNNNKPLDLSRPFRQTGLSSGAKLELVAVSRTPTAISVAVQVPEVVATGIPNGRLIDKFATDTTVWKILRHFEEKKEFNLNFTARGVTEIQKGTSGAGRIFYEMPVIHAMNRELSTFGDLQKTLAQLGLSGGNCLLRLTFKKTEQPLEEAMREIATYFKEEAPEVVEKAAVPETPKQEGETVASETVSPPKAGLGQNEDAEMADSTSVPEESEPKVVIAGGSQRSVAVFSPPSASMPQAALSPHNEDDYQPTIAHAKLHQARLLDKAQNKRLLSDAETEKLANEKAAKLAVVSEVSIKIRFPDQTSIVSSFKATETGLDLYKFVSNVIRAENQPFRLLYTSKGPQTIPRDDKKLLIKHLGLTGAVLVNFHWDDNADLNVRRQPILKSHLLESAQRVQVPDIPVVEASKDDIVPATVDKGKGKETSGGSGKSKGIPKWLNFGQKK